MNAILVNVAFLNLNLQLTNLLTGVDYLSPVVSSQRQVDAIYFDPSSVFHLVPRSIL